MGRLKRQADVDAEPFVDQARARATSCQIELLAELAQAVALAVVEVAVVGAGGQAGEVELDARSAAASRRADFRAGRRFPASGCRRRA